MAEAAGAIESNRDLWQFITGNSLLRPKELIGEEIKRNKTKLLQTLLIYKKHSNANGETLKTQRKVQQLQLNFVVKLSKFLALDEVQSYDLYRSYLMRDYRGSRKDLREILSVDRHTNNLIVNVRDYYFSERLYLLRSLKHLFNCFLDQRHPYYEQYNSFMNEAYKDGCLIKHLMSLYEQLCEEKAPTWQTHGNVMTDRQCTIWLQQNIKEQCELLELLLLYYKNTPCDPQSILTFIKSFKKQGFGRRQCNRHLLDESAEPYLQRIGFLQALLIVAGIDLESLQELHLNGIVTDHHLVSSAHFKEIETLIVSLGDCEAHSAVLLAWAALTHLLSDGHSSRVKKLGNKALQLGVFALLHCHLVQLPYSADTTISDLCHVIVYGLLGTVLSLFHEETLGNTSMLYSLASVLLRKSFLADDFWELLEDDEPTGVGSLLVHAKSCFPFCTQSLLQLYAALAAAGPDSASRVICDLQQMTQFTNRIDSSVRVHSTDDKMVWRLGQDLQPYPYPGKSVIVPRGTYGQLCTQKDCGSNVLQWDVTYDGWNVLLGEISILLQQIEHGAGAVEVCNIARVIEVCKVLESVLSVQASEAHQAVRQLPHITNALYQVIQRFSVLSPPVLDLLSSCLNVLNQLSSHEPEKVWHNLQQTALLPHLTHTHTDVVQATSGYGLNTGLCGGILAGYECTQGHYPVTVSLLKLIAALVQPLHKAGCVVELMACVLYVSREIFPIFQKWRYYTQDSQQMIGELCLEIFHKILNILGDDASVKKKEVSVRDVCVYSLLFTESGRALLDIVATGVDAVEADVRDAEAGGSPLIKLLRLAFSVLNRLLLLRPSELPPSPVERALSVQPANRDRRHIAATIAQYIYHRHDPRLPTLSTLLLKRMARVFPMSILACLGTDAETIRDTYLSRLQASTEDIQLKVGILELLSTCVEPQPGLLEMFINVSANDKTKSKNKTGCLETVSSLIQADKQGTYHCPSELLCAAFEFLHALWEGQQEMALEVLRKKDDFWSNVCLSLTRDLQLPSEKGVDQQVLAKEIETCAYIIRIVAMEIYLLQSPQSDKNLQAVFSDVVSSNRLEYWSQYLCSCLQSASSSLTETSHSSNTDHQLAHNALKLLLAWRNLLLVIATTKVSSFSVKDSTKDKLLQHLLEAIQCQFTNNTSAIHVKLAAVTSTFYLTLLKHWISATSDWAHTIEQLHQVLRQICIENDTVISSVQISITTAFTYILQHVRAQKLHASAIKGVDSRCLATLVPDVCAVLQISTNRLPVPLVTSDAADVASEESKSLELKLKLQVMSVCLLEELIATLDSADTWLPMLKQDSLLECLLTSLNTWIQARQGLKYVQSVMMLFLTLSRYKQAAEALALSGLSQHLCLVLLNLYSTDQSMVPTAMPTKVADSWTAVYRLSMRLCVAMLNTLTHNFLDDALNFVGVHQDRMKQSLQSVGVVLSEEALLEAEDTCCFLAELAHYKKQWKLHLPKVFNTLMMGVCIVLQRCISLLIRPRLLQDMIEKRNGVENTSLVSQHKLLLTPVARRLSQQSSTEDVEVNSEEVTSVQHSLLRITCYCLVAMRQFTPDLAEVILDSSVDVSEYEALLLISFSSGSVEQNALPSFGTLLSCINMCMAMHAKIDTKASQSSLKNATKRGMPHKSVVLFVLENSLVLLMSQAIRYLRQPSLPSREKQLLKRELSAELNSFLLSAQRYVRRGGSSPAALSTSVNAAGSPKQARTSFSSSATEQAFFKLVDTFVRQVLR